MDRSPTVVVTVSEIKDADVFMLLDRSGSMASCLTDAQGGYDTFITEMKNAPSGRYVSLWDFDTEHRLIYGLTLASKLPEAGAEKAYRLQPRGSTALLDAITRLIAYAEAHKDASRETVVVILTDGYENSSREATPQSVKAIIEQKQEDGWVFIYLGANQDAITVASAYGIPTATAASFDTHNMATTSGGTSSMMTRGLSGLGYSFSATERKSFVGPSDASGTATVTRGTPVSNWVDLKHIMRQNRKAQGNTGVMTVWNTEVNYDPDPLYKFE